MQAVAQAPGPAIFSGRFPLMTDDWRLPTDVHSVSHEIDAEPHEPGCRRYRGDAFRPAANRQAAAAEGADAGPAHQARDAAAVAVQLQGGDHVVG